MIYCTDNRHWRSEDHTLACLPPADPENLELRLLRAVYGLCPECDDTSPHNHGKDASTS